MQEIFKDIIGYEGLYQVSNLGNIKSLKYNREKILKLSINRYGYVVITLCKDSKKKLYTVHRLVALAFINNTNNYPVTNHKNGIKTDNKAENLEWCTQQHNIKHAFNIGLNHKGENHYARKFTNEQVLTIINDNRKVKDIALYYNVSINTIYYMKRKV